MSSRGYKSNPALLTPTDVVSLTKEQLIEYQKCMKDPIYFIKKYVKIKPVDGGELINFNLWKFQETMIKTFHENRFSICLNPRQSGKTMCVVAYILHYVLFNENVTAAILANKEKTAKEIMERVTIAYENIPNWLKQAVITWNKSSIGFMNGSKVLAGATSVSTIRGYSVSLLFCDEFAHVDKNKAEEFYKSVYPTISSGKNSKIILSSTPNGLNMFYRMWIQAQKKESAYIPLEFHWSEVPGRDDAWKAQTISNTSAEQFRQEFECEFIGSTHTLIAPTKLKELIYQIKSPIRSEEGLDIYEMPVVDTEQRNTGHWPPVIKTPGHTYAIMVDVSRGLGQDYSAFSVIDVTEIPYKQVAKYRHNEISPLLYPTHIYNVAKLYNDAFVLVEISDIGQQVADILHYELEYDNLVKVGMKGKQGQQVTAGHQKRIQFGVKTSHTTKRAGCANLKTLIESNKLELVDEDTIGELTTFTSQKDTYKAEEGYHDDLVMTLTFFGWFISQRHFKDSLKRDIRAVLQHEHLNVVEDDVIPFGFMDDHRQGMFENDEPGAVNWDKYLQDRQMANPFDTQFGREEVDYTSIDWHHSRK